MKYTLNILLLFTLFQSFAQNLVPNPSFEDTIACPTGAGQIYNATNWYSPNISSPDYYQTCAPFPVEVPTNFNGFESPFNGNAYCGIIIRSNVSWVNFREYIQARLINPLVIGNTYNIRLQLSVPEEMAIGSDAIGAHFSTEPISSNDNYVLNYSPQASNVQGNFITNKNGWTTVSMDFIADSSYEYITIGNFLPDVSTAFVVLDGGDTSVWDRAYLYIDDVEVVDISYNHQYPNVFTPNNDQINDFWKAPFSLKSYEIYILNRWGNIVSVLSEDNEIWNGTTTAGLECSEGVYYFSLIEKTTQLKIKSGFIQLIR